MPVTSCVDKATENQFSAHSQHGTASGHPRAGRRASPSAEPQRQIISLQDICGALSGKLAKKQKAHLFKPTLQNEPVSLYWLRGLRSVDGWDAFIGSLCLVQDDQVLGIVHLFLAQITAATTGKELCRNWGLGRGKSLSLGHAQEVGVPVPAFPGRNLEKKAQMEAAAHHFIHMITF